LPVIHPALFLSMRRFAESRGVVRQLYHKSETFQGICHSYQKCSEALGYWAKSDLEEAPDRQREYLELINELELEILQSIEEEQN
jgi:hypothetical protein